jgi:hypothetical protein
MAAKKKASTTTKKRRVTAVSARRPPIRKSSSPTRKKATRKRPAQRWSQSVTQSSDAMDLASGVFKLRSAKAIARSLKHSAETSKRRKSPPFRSAMSMLNFEINRAGKGLPEARRRVLNNAKDELRRLFHREPAEQTRAKKRSRSTQA